MVIFHSYVSLPEGIKWCGMMNDMGLLILMVNRFLSLFMDGPQFPKTFDIVSLQSTTTKPQNVDFVVLNTPIGSMYAIYGDIYHQYTPFMLAYIPAPWILWDCSSGLGHHHFFAPKSGDDAMRWCRLRAICFSPRVRWSLSLWKWCDIVVDPKKNKMQLYLVGGFNHLQKHESQLGRIILYIMEK